MADKEKNETTEDPQSEAEQAPETEAPETPEAEAAPEAEAPAAEPEPEPAPEAEAPEAEAEPEPEAAEPETPAEEAPEGDGAEEAEAPAGESAAAGPAHGAAQELGPKERRRRARSLHTGEPRPSRSPEERQAERQADRKRKAARRRARRLQERAKAAERRAAAPAPEPLAPVHAPVEGKRRERTGIVVSSKAEKTITVRIDIARRHRRYEKIVRSSSTLHAHDENNDAHEGDVVRVIESRPLSRNKRWALVDVLERAR
jgi:small subunit ribosomal protein S17